MQHNISVLRGGPSRVRALPLAAGINEGGHYFRYFGPSRVHALPLAAGINAGGHYFRYFGPSGVCALPLAGGINEGGHYFTYIIPFFLTTAIQNHRRDCRRVSNFCMGP
jgi:hypothetical protein